MLIPRINPNIIDAQTSADCRTLVLCDNVVAARTGDDPRCLKALGSSAYRERHTDDAGAGRTGAGQLFISS